MVHVHRVKLQDPIPSARELHITVRRVLFQLVDEISMMSCKGTAEIENNSAVELNSDNFQSIEDIVPEEVDICLELQLPKSFGKRKAQKTDLKKINVAKRQKKKSEIVSDFMSLATCEHNILLCLNEADGNYYPCRILGVTKCDGPSSHALVQFLGYDTFADVDRSKWLKPVSPEYVSMINECLEIEGGDMTSNAAMHPKFWDQRYRIFSKYDCGVLIPDEESWFSVTPEEIGIHIAKRLHEFDQNIEIILDCFSGCGGNAIHLAAICKLVIASDIDVIKLEALRQNAKIYGVWDRMELCVADAKVLLNGSLMNRSRSIDVVLLAPPWGGINYTESAINLESFGEIGNLVEMVKVSLCPIGARGVVLILPKTTHKTQFERMSKLCNFKVYVEDIYLWGKLKMTVAYIGPMFQNK